jgi:hypothetical protein
MPTERQHWRPPPPEAASLVIAGLLVPVERRITLSSVPEAHRWTHFHENREFESGFSIGMPITLEGRLTLVTDGAA